MKKPGYITVTVFTFAVSTLLSCGHDYKFNDPSSNLDAGNGWHSSETKFELVKQPNDRDRCVQEHGGSDAEATEWCKTMEAAGSPIILPPAYTECMESTGGNHLRCVRYIYSATPYYYWQ